MRQQGPARPRSTEGRATRPWASHTAIWHALNRPKMTAHTVIVCLLVLAWQMFFGHAGCYLKLANRREHLPVWNQYYEHCYEGVVRDCRRKVSTAVVTADASGSHSPHSFQNSRVALRGSIRGNFNLILAGNRIASPSKRASPISSIGSPSRTPARESGIKRRTTF